MELKLEIRELDRKYERLRIADSGRHGRLLASLSQHGRQTPAESKLDAVLRGLEQLSGACHRTCRAIREAGSELRHPAYQRRIRQMWRQGAIAYQALNDQLEGQLDVGC